MQAVLLLIALSCDVFLASAVCGAEQIKIKKKTALCVSLVCTGVLFLSYFLGKTCEGVITEQISDALGFIIFFVIGLWKLAECAIDNFFLKEQNKTKQLNFKISGFNVMLQIYRNPVSADRDHSHTMSAPEGILFALAMSADGFFGGFGIWANAFNPLVMLLNLPVTYLAVRSGAMTGRKILGETKYDFSWVGGAVFIALAFMR